MSEEGDDFEMDEEVQTEVELVLGTNPVHSPEAILVRNDVANRIASWFKTGIGKREEKENLFLAIPMKGQINLEAPALNEEIAVDLQPRVLARDNHFKDDQNLAGAALSTTSSVLSMILNDAETPLDREQILRNLSNSDKLLCELSFSLIQARKTFLMGRFDEKAQKILKKVEATAWLFGDNLKAVIETSKAMEKISKYLKSSNRIPLKFNVNALNWKSSNIRKKVGQKSYRSNQSRPTTSRSTNSSSKYKTPAKKYYTQTQPQRNRR